MNRIPPAPDDPPGAGPAGSARVAAGHAAEGDAVSTKRTHFSAKPLGPIREVLQPTLRSEAFKPLGLWYSVDDGWEEWCTSEMPEWIQGKLVYAIRLGRENILRITTLAELDAFHREFSRPDEGLGFMAGIGWSEVAKRFDGIEIAPYQYDRRLKNGFLWYYGWDCASGCIWRPRGVRVELLRDERIPEPAAPPAVQALLALLRERDAVLRERDAEIERLRVELKEAGRIDRICHGDPYAPEKG